MNFRTAIQKDLAAAQLRKNDTTIIERYIFTANNISGSIFAPLIDRYNIGFAFMPNIFCKSED